MTEFAYQRYAREKIEKRGKTAVIAPPGAGKTRPTIEGVLSRYNKSLLCPILVICSGPAIATWKRQFPQWGDVDESDIHIVTGSKPDRAAVLSMARDAIPGVYIMNAAVFRLDFDLIFSIRWGAVIADEYHKYMLRRKSATYRKFLTLTRHMDTVVLCTGSVVRRDPSSMFTAFQILDPRLKLFRSYWRFIKAFCILEDGYFGKEITGVRNVERLKELMDRYMAYIPEAVVADQLPEGLRSIMDVEMTEEQERIYSDLRDDMIAELGESDILVASTVMDKIVKMRQLLCCPRALDQSLGMGGGYEAILDEIQDRENKHVAIFAPFRAAVEEVTKQLNKDGIFALSLMGGATASEQAETLRRVKEKRGVLVCTILYAESFDLETCASSYFLGYDYSLDQNKQAEGRTRRAISDHKFVTWKYLRYRDTIDEDLLEKLIIDHINVHQVLKRSKDVISMLRGDYD